MIFVPLSATYVKAAAADRRETFTVKEQWITPLNLSR